MTTFSRPPAMSPSSTPASGSTRTRARQSRAAGGDTATESGGPEKAGGFGGGGGGDGEGGRCGGAGGAQGRGGHGSTTGHSFCKELLFVASAQQAVALRAAGDRKNHSEGRKIEMCMKWRHKHMCQRVSCSQDAFTCLFLYVCMPDPRPRSHPPQCSPLRKPSMRLARMCVADERVFISTGKSWRHSTRCHPPSHSPRCPFSPSSSPLFIASR